MIAYVFILVFIILSKAILNVNVDNFKSEKSTKLFLFLTGTVLVLFSGFRGDFTSDYVNYETLFRYYNSFSIMGVFSHQFGQEIGFVLLNWLLGRLFTNVVPLMIATSFIIVYVYLNEFRISSRNLWLSVFLFVAIGPYYSSFNLIRQVIASGIIFWGSRYLYNRSFFRYTAVVLLAALFHQTSLIMIPFFFLLNIKFNIKRFLLLFLPLMFFFGFNLTGILELIQNFVYSHYTPDSFGMTGFSIRNIMLSISLLILILYLYIRTKNNLNERTNIWLNATVYYTFFTVLGLSVQMLQRLSYFFAPYVLLIIPEILENIKRREEKLLYYFIIITLASLYNYVVLRGSGYDPYFFIWNRYVR